MGRAGGAKSDGHEALSETGPHGDLLPMTTQTQPSQPQAEPLRDLIRGYLRLGDPDIVGTLAVFPVFGPEPRLEYVSFAQGRSEGATITELEGGASVRDLVVHNPTSLPLLLFEGEEVLGAQQNRTLDLTVLVGSETKTRIPVSCVEQGRWDGRRHAEKFDPAPQAAYPELRRSKSRQVREAVRAGVEARADQSTVWSEVSAKAARHGVRSATGAMNDVFENRRGRLHEMTEAVRLHDGQLGALVMIAGLVTVLDLVSRPSVFGDLHGPLVQGYALDAIEAPGQSEPNRGDAEGFLSLALDNPAHRRPSVGIGVHLAFEGNGSEGSGLAVGEELVQLTAFPGDGQAEAQHSAPGERASRIRRPSRRQA